MRFLMLIFATIAACCAVEEAFTKPFTYLGEERRETIEGQGYTTVEITDTILAEKVSRFGINIGGDGATVMNPMIKRRTAQGFEGTMYRSCVQVIGLSEDGTGIFVDQAAMKARYFEPMKEIYTGAVFTILSGKAKGITGRITDLTEGEYTYSWKKTPDKVAQLILDTPVPGITAKDGILIEADEKYLDMGYIPGQPSYWSSENLDIVQETRPESLGRVSLRMDGTTPPKQGGTKNLAEIRLPGTNPKYMSTDGLWHIRFWCKATEGTPSLKLTFARGHQQTITPTTEWTEQSFDFTLSGINESVTPLFQVTGGKMLLDDVLIDHDVDENPTPFNDEFISIMKRLNVGIIRKLQMGGNSIEHILKPAEARAVHTSSAWYFKTGNGGWRERNGYSIGDLYAVCEYLNCEPWFCIPGTLYVEEMDLLMEYLGGPAGTKGGDIRIAQGHPEPWTKTLRKIHLEYGNEAWNNFGPYVWGGYNGPEYWGDLTERIKSSPYYNDNIVVHAGSQNWGTHMAKRLCADHPNMDRLTVAPYLIHKFYKHEEELLQNDHDLLRYAMAYSLDTIIGAKGMRGVVEATKKAGMAMAVYEFNYHMTQGDAGTHPRYAVTFSLAGGINIINQMLLMMREYPAKEQCFFNLAQEYYKVGDRLNPGWGAVLSKKTGAERLRPNALALELANRAIFDLGDCLEVKLRGENPTFDSEGYHFMSIYKKDKKATAQLTDVPMIWSHAFTKENKRSLVLLNYDLEKSRTVKVVFPGAAENVQSWILTAEEATASNEWNVGDLQVATADAPLSDFASGSIITLPACSMHVITWTTE